MIQLPKIDLRYWLLMILATTIGEIIGNLISRDFGLGYIVGSTLLIGTFAAALSTVIFLKFHNEKSYWILILLGNIAGTDVADLTTRTLGLGNISGSLVVLAVLSTIFLLWYVIIPKFMINTRLNSVNEFLYWFAILISSTFGTTFGDFLSSDTPLGSSGGSLLLFAILLATAALVRLTKIHRMFCYWLALVVIHPIGATVGNYISKPEGLNLGNIWTSIALIFMFLSIFFDQWFMKLRSQPIVDE